MKDKKILVVGHIGMEAQTETLRHIVEADHEVVIVQDSQPIENSIEVNGVKYVPIQRENNRINKKPSRLAQILLTTSLMYMPYLNDLYGYGSSSNQRKLPDNIDIIKEYGLIQNKESKLSKWERDKVVRIFEYNYKIIK